MNKFVIAFAAASIGFASPALAQDAEGSAAQIDYPSFSELTAEVFELRNDRLLPREQFFERAQAEGALLLDTRSAEAFAAGHLEGAVNLPFSDFTADKLRSIIGQDTGRPIYIYCNNNFTDNVFPIRLKSAPLALNIPTFINLVGYGYENVWELDGAMSISEVQWVAINPLEQLAIKSAP